MPGADALSSLLRWLDSVAAGIGVAPGWSWVLAVVLLTAACRAALIPVVANQLSFQRRMDAVRPEIDALRSRHGADLTGLKRDPRGYLANWARNEEEQGALLRRNGIRWWAGLLPALVQIPVWVVVLRVLSSGTHTDGLAAPTWTSVPSPTASFLHTEEAHPLLAGAAVLVGVLVHGAQRLSLALRPQPPSPTARRVRLLGLPLAAGLLALNLGLAVLVSVATSIVWGMGQARWLAARQRQETAVTKEPVTS